MIRVQGNQFFFRDHIYRCSIGKGGISAAKKEGDGATPIGIFPLRECWYRSDRLRAPETKLPIKIIHENDGWCDDPKSPDYNRHIIIPPPVGGRLGGGRDSDDLALNTPLPSSPLRGEGFECLYRDDHCYDLIIPLGYNDAPVVCGKGSAIFMHVMHDSGRATEGCIALEKADLLAILPHLGTDISLEVLPGGS